METLIAKYHLHPIIDHFTIALLGIGVLADVAGYAISALLGNRSPRARSLGDRLRGAALVLLVPGAISAIFSRFTGESEAERVWDTISPAAQHILFSDTSSAAFLSHAVLGTYLMYAFVALAGVGEVLMACARGVAQSLSAVQDRNRRSGNPLYPCPLAAPGRDAAACFAWMAGSIVEFQKIIEPLTNPTAHGGEADDAFHLVCPSLPGYGFSDKPTRTGWNVQRIANAWSELMLRLGDKRYAAQGGDWGGAVTTCIGFQDPANCLGIHVNLPLVLHLLVRIDPSSSDLTVTEKIGVRWLPVLQRLGLRVLQGTEYAAADRWLRPQRLARRPNGLDPREVLGMDRLRRAVRRTSLPATNCSTM